MSGEYVSRLKRRARGFLEAAEKSRDMDLAAFFIEQSMQLYLKAVFYELFGDRIRGHGIRSLLGALSRSLRKHGYEKISDKIEHFVGEHKRDLALAEEAYTGGRYGDVSYSEEDVKNLMGSAEKLIKLLDEVVRNVKLG